ncbi:MAG: hypothetical protein WB729_16225 [Candidatus Sulfotelmatobacter sp.]
MFGIGYYKLATLVLVTSAFLTLVNVAPRDRLQPQQEAPTFLIAAHEGTIDLSRNGTSSQTCILVRPDGRFHLEGRTQRLPSPTASAKIFDYSLDSSQLQQLRGIIDDESVRQLPEYIQPPLPMAVSWSHGFEAKITRPTGAQDIGYWTWRGGTVDASPNSARESVRKGWQQSETALKPLVDWLHGIEALKLSPSDSKSDMCVVDADLR